MGIADLLKFKETNRKVVSIDFGASFIKLAHLESRGGKSVLLGYALKELNCAEQSSEELGRQIKGMLEANSVATKETYLNISDPEHIFIKKLILPQMSKDELLNAIKWQLKGEFTFSPDEDVFDLQVIREYADSEGAKKIELFCVFAKRALINKYLSAVTSCGLMPLKISSSVFNYSPILDLLPVDSKINAILDIGCTHSNILIYQGSKLNFIRNLSFSTSKLTASLVGSLVTDQGKVEITPEKARQLIRQYGIVLDESTKLQSDIESSQIIPLIRPLLEILAKELERSFDFFKSESGFDIPGVLYITGGGANLKNLNSYLAESLKIKVEKLPLADLIDTQGANTEEFILDANQLSGSIGLGLSSSGINLLPSEVKSQKAEKIQKSSLRILAVAVSAVFIFSWFAVNFQIRDYKKRLQIAKLHLESVEEINTIKQKVDARENYVNKIYEGKVVPAGLLKLISSIIPPSIILDEFNFDQSSHTMSLSGVIGLSSESVERVLTDFMNNLESSKFVLDTNLVNSKEEQGANTFEIECQLVK